MRRSLEAPSGARHGRAVPVAEVRAIAVMWRGWGILALRKVQRIPTRAAPPTMLACFAATMVLIMTFVR